MLTIRPYPASFITGATARQQRNVPSRLTPSTSPQLSSASVQVGPLVPTTPALLTRISTLPNASVAVATAAATCSASRTSATAVVVRSGSNPEAAVARPSASVSTRQTAAPRAC